MVLQTLEESLLSLGLSMEEIRQTFPAGEEEVVDGLYEDDAATEVGYISDEVTGSEGDGDDPFAYLESPNDDDDSDVADDDQDDDDLDAYIESLSDDDVDAMLDEIFESFGMEEGFIRLRPVSKRKVARKKMKKWLKTSAGRAYARDKKRTSKTAVAKKKQKKHAAKLAARGGPIRGKMFREAASDEQIALESMLELQDAVDNDPEENFHLFARSFNALADVGELIAGSMLESNDDGARVFAAVAVGAEEVLRRMEALGESVYRDDREILEATLAEAVDCVGTLISKHDIVNVDTGAISARLADAVDAENVDESLSIWAVPESVSDTVMENILKIQGAR